MDDAFNRLSCADFKVSLQFMFIINSSYEVAISKFQLIRLFVRFDLGFYAFWFQVRVTNQEEWLIWGVFFFKFLPFCLYMIIKIHWVVVQFLICKCVAIMMNALDLSLHSKCLCLCLNEFDNFRDIFIYCFFFRRMFDV